MTLHTPQPDVEMEEGKREAVRSDNIFPRFSRTLLEKIKIGAHCARWGSNRLLRMRASDDLN